MARSQDDRVSRRTVLSSIAGAGAVSIAGCQGTGEQSDGGSNSDDGSDGGSGGLSGDITITGSSTVFPISDALAEEFMEEHPDVSITVDSTGSGGGFENHFCPGNSDINGASRPIKEAEQENCQGNDVEPFEMHIAGDALTVAVNNENDWAECLTFEELSMIWREDGVDNWADVRDGFPDEPIEMFGPASTSGTYDWFTENVVNFDDEGRNHTAEHEPTEEDNLIVQGIKDNVGGIGYFGYAYYSSNSDQVKALNVRETADDECGSPGLDTASEGTYPMARPLFIYPDAEAVQRDEVYEFLKFYAEEAQTEVVRDIGYVPSNEEMVQENLDAIEQHR